MPNKPLYWHIFPRLLLLVFPLALLLIFWHFYTTRQSTISVEQRELRHIIEVLTPSFSSAIIELNEVEIQRLCKKYHAYKRMEISVILPDGRVIGNSRQSPDSIPNQSYRQDFVLALQRSVNSISTFLQNDRGVRTSYFSRAFYLAGEPRAVLSISRQMPAYDFLSTSYLFIYLLILLLSLILTAFVSTVLVRFIKEPIDSMTEAACAIYHGDSRQRFLSSEITEMAALSNEIGRLTSLQLAQIDTITHQLNQQEAILSGMTEGVVAVDNDERIIIINNAAVMLLSLDALQMTGKLIQEVIRNVDFQRFVIAVFASDIPEESDISLRDGSDRYLQANGTKLYNSQGKTTGAVIVLNDMTRIRRLENIRRNFVANVSHELRTPITSIKGFVETLLDGAWDNRDDAENFLQVISRQVDRMNVLIEDLLLLSTLEQSGQRTEIGMESSNIKEIITHAIQQCQLAARAKEIELQLNCATDIIVSMIPALIEQAVVNLVDNAIKYSGEKSAVTINVGKVADEVLISVIDQGNGISSEHLPRLFERFYRVDKARSRKLGGTGLGLSIVKHIALVHGGRVAVETEIGKGSSFSIYLPIGNGENN